MSLGNDERESDLHLAFNLDVVEGQVHVHHPALRHWFGDGERLVADAKSRLTLPSGVEGRASPALNEKLEEL